MYFSVSQAELDTQCTCDKYVFQIRIVHVGYGRYNSCIYGLNPGCSSPPVPPDTIQHCSNDKDGRHETHIGNQGQNKARTARASTLYEGTTQSVRAKRTCKTKRASKNPHGAQKFAKRRYPKPEGGLLEKPYSSRPLSLKLASPVSIRCALSGGHGCEGGEGGARAQWAFGVRDGPWGWWRLCRARGSGPGRSC